jgi:dihydrofolate reductase
MTRRLIAFEHISLDGYYADANNDMGWARPGMDDPEFHQFAQSNAQSGGELIFGRITYDLMAAFWPSAMAKQSDPLMAERINRASKTVFSRQMKKADWENTKVIGGDIVAETRKMKNAPGAGMTILGSGTIVSQLAEAGLIDEFQLVVTPVILGSGKSLFAGVTRRPPLKLTKDRRFKNGKIVLSYEPA